MIPVGDNEKKLDWSPLVHKALLQLRIYAEKLLKGEHSNRKQAYKNQIFLPKYFEYAPLQME